MLNPEQRELIEQCAAAFNRASNALLAAEKPFSWQGLEIDRALSEMYVAGMRAAALNMRGSYHEAILEMATKSNY